MKKFYIFLFVKDVFLDRLKDWNICLFFSCNFEKLHKLRLSLIREDVEVDRREVVIARSLLLSSWWNQGCWFVAVSGRHRVLAIWKRRVRSERPAEAPGRGRLLNNYTNSRVCNCVYSTDLKLASTDYFGIKIKRCLSSSNIRGILISLSYLSVHTRWACSRIQCTWNHHWACASKRERGRLLTWAVGVKQVGYYRVTYKGFSLAWPKNGTNKSVRTVLQKKLGTCFALLHKLICLYGDFWNHPDNNITIKLRL